ncbi:MAG: DUF3105 domain-containing protein [Actinomycetota bacterium]
MARKRSKPSARAVRTERAREERRALERDRARRRRYRIAGGILGGALILFGLAALVIYLHRLSPFERRLLAQAPRAAAAAGCTEVRRVPPFPDALDRTHIGGGDAPVMPPLSRYRSVPPVSGPHAGAALRAGNYDVPPPVDMALHSLEHAAVIVWYDPGSASDPALGEVRRFFETSDEGTHVIVAPYDYPEEGEAGRLLDGTGMALAAWHHVQLCERVSLPVAFSFVEAYRFNLYRWGSYQGDAPERFAPI